MGVETLSFERFVCDRCDAVEEIPCGQVELRDRWGHASAQHYQGGQIFAHNYRTSLCPNCCASLRAWAARDQADHGVIERDRLAKLVEQMIDYGATGVYAKPAARMALAIAASVVRRGRHLTDSEKLCNLATAMEEPIAGDTPEDIASSMAIAARIRKAAGAA